MGDANLRCVRPATQRESKTSPARSCDRSGAGRTPETEGGLRRIAVIEPADDHPPCFHPTAAGPKANGLERPAQRPRNGVSEANRRRAPPRSGGGERHPRAKRSEPAKRRASGAPKLEAPGVGLDSVCAVNDLARFGNAQTARCAQNRGARYMTGTAETPWRHCRWNSSGRGIPSSSRQAPIKKDPNIGTPGERMRVGTKPGLEQPVRRRIERAQHFLLSRCQPLEALFFPGKPRRRSGITKTGSEHCRSRPPNRVIPDGIENSSFGVMARAILSMDAQFVVRIPNNGFVPWASRTDPPRPSGSRSW
jgi:hypothetical protein